MITKIIEGGVNKMLFKSKKEKSKKEFIQYKDGKIVSIEVDKPRKPQGVLESEEIPLYQEIKEEKPKVKTSEKLKKWMTLKKLKVMIAIVVLVFFAFTVMDIYKAFFTEDTQTSPTAQVEEPSGATHVQKPTPTLPTSTNTSKPSEKPTEKPSKTSTDKEKPSQKEDNKKPSTSKDSLKMSLDTANIVNQSIVTQSTTEIKYINDYAERKANKIGLGNQLEKSLKDKQDVYFTFTMNVKAFDDATKKMLYKSTEERMMASIQFTKNAQLFLQQGRGKEALRIYANEYVVTDEALREKQVNALIDVLKQNKVSYKINEATKNVEFVLP